MTNKEFFIQTWQNEMLRTLSAVNGLPADRSKLEYKPDEKARTAAEILGHILPHAEVMVTAIKTHIAAELSSPKEFLSKETAAAYFIKHATVLADQLLAMEDVLWEELVIDFQLDGCSLYSYTMANTFWMFLFDIIHHRGQLSTYYRHMGVRNPPIYGPTAEDREAMRNEL